MRQHNADKTTVLSNEVYVDIKEAGKMSAVYPNPFNPQATFTLSVDAAQQVRVAVFDLLGREVARVYQGRLEAGASRSFTLDGSGLSSGTYLLRVIGEHFTDYQRISLVK